MKVRDLILSTALLLLSAAAAAEPLEMFNNRLFVPVRVNGVAATALLDSGAEMTVLDDDFAERIGLTPSGSAVARGSGAQTMEARFVDSVAIEGVGTRIAPRAAVLDLGEVSARLIGRPVDLVLGRELFDSCRLRLDLAGGTIDVAAAELDRGIRLELSQHRGIPTIPAMVNGEPVQSVFDLGNGSEVLIGRAFAERLGLTASDYFVERRRGGGLGGSVERDIVRLPRLTLAGRDYEGVLAAIDDGESASDLNIGTSILRDFLITTDFPGGAIWLESR